MGLDAENSGCLRKRRGFIVTGIYRGFCHSLQAVDGFLCAEYVQVNIDSQHSESVLRRPNADGIWGNNPRPFRELSTP